MSRWPPKGGALIAVLAIALATASFAAASGATTGTGDATTSTTTAGASTTTTIPSAGTTSTTAGASTITGASTTTTTAGASTTTTTVGASTSSATASATTTPTGGTDAEIEGVVRTGHGDDLQHGREVDAVTLDTGTGPVELELPPGRELALGHQVHVRGHAEGGKLQVAADGATDSGVATGGGSGSASTAYGTKTVAVVLLNFSNDTSQPWTTSTVRNVVFDGSGSVNAFYQADSQGQLSLTGDVFGWYTLSASNTSCDYTSWANAAQSAATAAGVNLSSYQYTVYAFPGTSSCAWSGVGYLPGTTSWINGGMTLRAVAHELGHNFGIHHASSENCTDASGTRVTLSSNCTVNEYGDPFSIMGAASTRLHHNWHNAQLGWLSGVQTVTANGSYTLAPAQSTSSPRLLRVARADGTYLQLEYRQPSGVFDNFASSDPAVNGVTIRIAPDTGTIVQSKLLDATPDTSTLGDAPLAVARTFTDPATGVQITTQSVSASGATVSIQVAAPADTQAPSTPGNPKATITWATSLTLSWTASLDNVGVTGYRILRNGTQVATSATAGYVDAALTPATSYTYQVIAVDAAGNSSPPAQTSATTGAAYVTSPQGSWVSNSGSQGYVLGAWNGSTASASSDLAALPSGATFTLDQGSRSCWTCPTTDVRGLQSPDTTQRRAAAWYDPTQLRARLSFASAYTGTLRLYALDWDSTARREKVTVDDGHGPQRIDITTSFDQGAWLSFPIAVAGGATVAITVDRTAGSSAVLSGIFLGWDPTVHTQDPCGADPCTGAGRGGSVGGAPASREARHRHHRQIRRRRLAHRAEQSGHGRRRHRKAHRQRRR